MDPTSLAPVGRVVGTTFVGEGVSQPQTYLQAAASFLAPGLPVPEDAHVPGLTPSILCQVPST